MIGHQLVMTAPKPAPRDYPRFIVVGATELGYWRVRTEAIEEDFIAFNDAHRLFCELLDPRLCQAPVNHMAC